MKINIRDSYGNHKCIEKSDDVVISTEMLPAFLMFTWESDGELLILPADKIVSIEKTGKQVNTRLELEKEADRVLSFYPNSNTIGAIKELRNTSKCGLGLKEAKAAIDEAKDRRDARWKTKCRRYYGEQDIYASQQEKLDRVFKAIGYEEAMITFNDVVQLTKELR